MKKKVIAAALAVVLAAAALPSAVLAEEKEKLTEVTLNEVAHSMRLSMWPSRKVILKRRA